MRAHIRSLALAVSSALSLGAPQLHAQIASVKPATPLAATAATAVPALVPFSGVASDPEGKPLAGEAAITFLIYKDEQGGEALFTESQTIALDAFGRYRAQLGATLSNGIPLELFNSGEARWLEVQVAGQPSQPRILLVSVPYALKAGDASTLGGLPPSAYALAGSKGTNVAKASITPDLVSDVTTTGGTSGYVPVFNGASTVVDSPIFLNGNNLGIGTVTPTATLDVDGAGLFSGGLTVDGVSTLNGFLLLPALGTATTATSYNSQYFKLVTSAYNSSTKTIVAPRFQLQAEVKGNNTANPIGTLNLIASNGPASPTETGFSIQSNGIVNFAPGQTFPGAGGSGTITGVTAGAGLTGGGTSGNVTLAVNPATVPQLTAANTFTNTQTISGGDLNLPATTSASVGVLNIGGIPFLHGYTQTNQNVFVGGAGNFTTTGGYNVGVGAQDLIRLTTGSNNTAAGFQTEQYVNSGNANSGFGTGALYFQTTGSLNAAVGYAADEFSTSGTYNTAMGAYALDELTTGSEDTGLGYGASVGTTSVAITDATAVGALSTVSQNNSLVLGQTYQGSPGFNFVNVGIGTDTPRSILEAAASSSGSIGPTLTLTNSGSGTNTAASLDFNTYLPSTGGTYNPGARIEAIDDGLNDDGTNLFFSTNTVGAANRGLRTDMAINSGYGAVGVGLSDPQSYGYQFVALAAYGVEAIYGQGSSSAIDDYSSSGVIGQGGNNTSGSSGAGAGGVFFGGDTSGSAFGGDGVIGSPGYSTSGPVGYAGSFDGNVNVTGALTVSGVKNFKIDHPLDPANKYLVHASVESSEMMNIYTGNAVTDELGLATVKLPEWFEAENTDFRYQLTVIGRKAQAWVAQEVGHGQFQIASDATNTKVSWQITAVRQDAYAKANPMVVEQEKPAAERGYYSHPELFGQPAERQTEWGRHPQLMQKMKAQRERQLKTQQLASPEINRDQPASAVNRTFTHPSDPAMKLPTPGVRLKLASPAETK